MSVFSFGAVIDILGANLNIIDSQKKYHNFEELLMTNDTWEVK